MSYSEGADRLSKKNKEFIKALFPEGVVYASLFAPRRRPSSERPARPDARGREAPPPHRLPLRHRVDPFDGRPRMFTARMGRGSPRVADTRRSKADRPFSAGAGGMRALLAEVELPEAPFFRAIMAEVRDEGPRGFAIEADAWELLQLHHSSPIAVLRID